MKTTGTNGVSETPEVKPSQHGGWSAVRDRVPLLIPLAVGLVLLFQEAWVWGSVLLILFVLLTLVNVTAPRLYGRLTTRLERLGRRTGDAVAWVLLGLIYLLVFIPASLIGYLTGRDRLQLRSARITYWIDRSENGGTDLGHPWGRELRGSVHGTRPALLKGARFALVILLILVTLDAALGIGSRAVIRLVRPEHSHYWRVAPGDLEGDERLRFARELEAVLGAATFRPFLHYRRADFSGRYFNVRSGVRQTYGSTSPEEAPSSVFVFGGSAAWGFAARDDRTLPSEISRIAESEGLKWQVVNYAEPGYVSWQEVILLAELCASGRIPDVAVFYDGFNDVIARLLEPESTRPMIEQKWWERGVSQMLRGTLPLPSAESLLSRYRTISFTATLLRRAGLMREHLGSVETQSRIEPLMLGRDAARTYLENVELVQALADRYDFRAVFIWQPTLYAKPHRTPEEQRVLRSAEQGEEAMEAMLMETTNAVAASPDVMDLSTVFIPISDRVFLDRVHIAEPYNRLIAARIFPSIRTAIEESAGEKR